MAQIQQFCAIAQIAQCRKFYIKQLLLLVTVLILYRKLYFFYTANNIYFHFLQSIYTALRKKTNALNHLHLLRVYKTYQRLILTTSTYQYDVPFFKNILFKY